MRVRRGHYEDSMMIDRRIDLTEGKTWSLWGQHDDRQKDRLKWG